MGSEGKTKGGCRFVAVDVTVHFWQRPRTGRFAGIAVTAGTQGCFCCNIDNKGQKDTKFNWARIELPVCVAYKLLSDSKVIPMSRHDTKFTIPLSTVVVFSQILLEQWQGQWELVTLPPENWALGGHSEFNHFLGGQSDLCFMHGKNSLTHC